MSKHLHLTFSRQLSWQYTDNSIIWDNGTGDGVKLAKQLEAELEHPEIELSAIAQLLRGGPDQFAIMIEIKSMLFAAVDHMRSVPLFYHFKNFRISDDPDWLLGEKILPSMFTRYSKYEFLLSGIVSGQDTLIEDVKQIQAGEFLLIDKRTKIFKTQRYFSQDYHISQRNLESQDWIDLFDQTLNHTFEKLYQKVKDRPVMLPLSGGYDSRLLAYKLKEFGHTDMHAFTYEVKNMPEVNNARRVAEHLGLKWNFVPYTRSMWYDWYHSQDRKDFFTYSMRYASFGHSADFPAIKYLVDKDKIPENAVLIPGHALDATAGDTIPQAYFSDGKFDKAQVLNDIYAKFYDNWPEWKNQIDFKDYLDDKLACSLHLGENHYSGEEAANLWEDYNDRERQAKYILNSLRVYEHFGFTWEIPFWEKGFFDFWKSVPMEQKKNRVLQMQYMAQKVNIPVPANPKKSIPERLKYRMFAYWLGRFAGNKSLPLAWMSQVKDLNYTVKAPFINQKAYLYPARVWGLYALSQMEHYYSEALDNKTS